MTPAASNARLFLISIFISVLLPAARAAADDAGARPLHDQVLALLRAHRDPVTRLLPDVNPRHTAFNHEAPIPPQCYTKTDGRFNPCYVCHQNQKPGRENAMNDGELQVEYAFSDVGMTNHWKNLFEDRSAAVAAISDAEILDWIDDDNYSALAGRLREAGFDGWIPDLASLQEGAAAFDEHGFAKDGSHWVAFNYKPFPSTFWPTNGSTDDVMIRLAEPFRSDAEGNYSADVYRANLAIVEAQVKGFDEISCLPVDERRLGVDVDADGVLGTARMVRRLDAYVGAASGTYVDRGLYPEGTEFLHTVRYVGFDAGGRITLSRRMKEVRYLRKWRRFPKEVYAREYQLEGFAKEVGRLPKYLLIGDKGLDNGFGWSVQSFIEGVDGALRQATYEENLFCMGCHTSIGATIDKTFSFPRKIDGAAGWGYINLVGMPDAPSFGEDQGEISTYLERVGGGGEFRSNPEMAARWFKADGSVNSAAVAAAPDVYALITPSRERALMLNKAYRAIVAEQDYLYGRDAFVTPPANVYEFIDNDTAPTLPLEHFHTWDIRLDWAARAAP
ncbi:MAG: hypothetical protein RLW62_00230 [Gammaproteobacteria bacterium]